MIKNEKNFTKKLKLWKMYCAFFMKVRRLNKGNRISSKIFLLLHFLIKMVFAFKLAAN